MPPGPDGKNKPPPPSRLAARLGFACLVVIMAAAVWLGGWTIATRQMYVSGRGTGHAGGWVTVGPFMAWAAGLSLIVGCTVGPLAVYLLMTRSDDPKTRRALKKLFSFDHPTDPPRTAEDYEVRARVQRINTLDWAFALYAIVSILTFSAIKRSVSPRVALSVVALGFTVCVVYIVARLYQELRAGVAVRAGYNQDYGRAARPVMFWGRIAFQVLGLLLDGTIATAVWWGIVTGRAH
jgi:hypothetical protein